MDPVHVYDAVEIPLSNGVTHRTFEWFVHRLERNQHKVETVIPTCPDNIHIFACQIGMDGCFCTKFNLYCFLQIHSHLQNNFFSAEAW